MSAQPNIRQGTIEVANALAELGLRLEYVNDAVLSGELARDSCTANDPPGAGGYFSYSRTTRALREILAPLGWSRDDSGLSTVINPDASIAIDVVTGNIGTGNSDAFPNCKYPRGRETDRAVFSNQLSLLDTLEWQEGVRGNDSGQIIRQTWMLLRKRVGDRVNVELSLPESMTADGFVERWAVRIILDIDLGLELAAAVVDESVPPVDVPVRRRS